MRIVAVDLASPTWLSGQGDACEFESLARLELAKELVGKAVAVGTCCDSLRWGWREASQATIKWREEAEAGRGMLRLALRAWREVRDGVQAGTARWEARLERDDAEGALARRVMFGPRDKEGTVQVTQEAFYGEEAWQLRTLLAYMRLVRAGHVGAARRRSPTWQRVQHERRLRDLQISWEHAMPGERWRTSSARSDACPKRPARRCSCRPYHSCRSAASVMSATSLLWRLSTPSIPPLCLLPVRRPTSLPTCARVGLTRCSP